MIHLTFQDGKSVSFPKGTLGLSIVQQLYPSLAETILAMEVNGLVCDLSYAIQTDATVRFLTWDDQEGKQVFWHSAAHLLAAACMQLYPGIQLGIGPAIEQGFYYDMDLGSYSLQMLDMEKIEQTMLELAGQKHIFSCRAVTYNQAIDFFTTANQPYKVELLKALKDPTKITLYQQGDFVDLCKGPHLPHVGLIKAVKILNIAGAYWRGNENNKQLTRLYGIAFPHQEALNLFLQARQEALQRNHQNLNKTLQLFTFSDKVGLGLPLWLPNGALLCERLIQFLRQEQLKRGYQPVITPHIGHKALYITSGHYEKYRQDCFQPIETGQDEEAYLLKPMNCPHHCEIYNHTLRSYKDLPLRFAEFGTIYRYESHGALNGLVRTRCFTQDDAHIFCRQDQVEQEIKQVIDLILYVFKVFQFTDYTARLSFRDPLSDHYIGQDQDWELAEQALQNIASCTGLKTTCHLGEAAFYGPKVDFIVKDTLGRSWQLGTVQLDYQLPVRFDLYYIGADGKKHRPVMIHRAPFGSLERFIAILTEHTGGKYPVWLAPEQVVILPISEKYIAYAAKIHRQLIEKNLLSHIDSRNETIRKKIREAELRKVPYMMVLGQQEEDNQTITVRKRGRKASQTMDLKTFVEWLSREIQEKRDDIL